MCISTIDNGISSCTYKYGSIKIDSSKEHIVKMPIRLFAILIVIGSPFSASASQLFYKCKYPASWVEYSIDTRTNTIKAYSESLFSVSEDPISYISPTRIIWNKKNKLGPRLNYIYPDKTVHEEHNYSNELNIEKSNLTTLQKSCDYAEGRCWAKTYTYKCYRLK